MFYEAIVYYISIILLTLQVVNNLWINISSYYKRKSKVVDNVLITLHFIVINKKSRLLEKSFQLN